MSVLIDRSTRVLVQGITGREGRFQTQRCIEYGTNVVAGATPGRGGESVEGVPVFDTVREAVRRTSADCSLVLVPPASTADAILEAADAGIPLVVCITDGVPVLDMVRVKRILSTTRTRLVGPNCPGVITPGQCKVGIMPGDVFLPGRVGVISRSGTLMYEAVYQLTRLGIGQSTCVGCGGDPILGTTPREALELLNADPDTDAIVLIGEIGGLAEQEAAEYIAGAMRKPVVAFVAGSAAPPGRRMGHAGAIVSGNVGTSKAKEAALSAAGAVLVQSPDRIGATVEQVLRGQGLLSAARAEVADA